MRLTTVYAALVLVATVALLGYGEYKVRADMKYISGPQAFDLGTFEVELPVVPRVVFPIDWSSEALVPHPCTGEPIALSAIARVLCESPAAVPNGGE
jgi:hypothetical protein